MSGQMKYGTPEAPKGWDTKTQSSPTQVHHGGQVHHEHGPLMPVPTPTVEAKEDPVKKA
jgi:hypothetical protein